MATKTKFLAVVWAIQSLIPYIEESYFKVRTNHNAAKLMLTCNDENEKLLKWRISLGKFNCEVLYRLGLVHQIPDTISILLHPSDTQECEPIEN